MAQNGFGDEPKHGSFEEHDATITQTHAFGDQIDNLSNYQLERGLKSRHIQYARTSLSPSSC